PSLPEFWRRLMRLWDEGRVERDWVCGLFLSFSFAHTRTTAAFAPFIASKQSRLRSLQASQLFSVHFAVKPSLGSLAKSPHTSGCDSVTCVLYPATHPTTTTTKQVAIEICSLLFEIARRGERYRVSLCREFLALDPAKYLQALATCSSEHTAVVDLLIE